MNLFSQFFDEIFAAPFSSVIIVISLWIYVKIGTGDWETRMFQSNYTFCYRNRELWRILTSPLCHGNIFHTLFNISSLWSLRIIEVLYGTIYALKYSLLFCIFDGIATLMIIHFMVKTSRIDSNEDITSITNSSNFGLSSIILGNLLHDISFLQI